MANKLAVITGASTGIGYELAKIAGAEGYDLIVVADEPQIAVAANDFGAGAVRAVEADLATFDAEVVARTIAALDIPVFTGIGHEIDRSVADEVAHTAFKTPTACAAAIVTSAREVLDDLLALRTRSLYRLGGHWRRPPTGRTTWPCGSGARPRPASHGRANASTRQQGAWCVRRPWPSAATATNSPHSRHG